MSRPEPEFDEPRDPEVRATNIVEEEGLPEDNPFTEVVEGLRDADKSWLEIIDLLNDVYDVIDKAGSEAMSELVPEWKVAVVVHDPDSTSGESYEYYTRAKPTAEEAEEAVRDRGLRVESEKTEQVGVAKILT